MFAITQGKGFSIQFENGYKISVQFGTMNYCKNASKDHSDRGTYKEFYKCEDAEIAIFKDNEFIRLPLELRFDESDFAYDDVIGHCSADKVAHYINIISTL